MQFALNAEALRRREDAIASAGKAFDYRMLEIPNRLRASAVKIRPYFGVEAAAGTAKLESSMAMLNSTFSSTSF
jgi:hypothetical protein